MTLAEFLRARLAEDEKAARPAFGLSWPSGSMTPAEERYLTHHDPERALAEVEAKRRIIHAHARPHECISLTERGEHSVVDGQPWELWEPQHTADSGPCFVLRCLALPYADHPDYREEWRP